MNTINETSRWLREDFDGYCPLCKSSHISMNGTVDVPPFLVQTSDAERGITREYLAERYMCDDCFELFDVVIRDSLPEEPVYIAGIPCVPPLGARACYSTITGSLGWLDYHGMWLHARPRSPR